MIRIKRAYEPPVKADGARVLVDRLWPRGCTKEHLALEAWLKDATPSADLRKAYHAGALSFEAFESRYRQELAQPEAREALDQLAAFAQQGALTLVTANRNEDCSHALVLKSVLESHLEERP